MQGCEEVTLLEEGVLAWLVVYTAFGYTAV
jgi:hypothetical protein